MPAYKDSKTGTWFVKFYCKDWTGENKQIKKRKDLQQRGKALELWSGIIKYGRRTIWI